MARCERGGAAPSRWPGTRGSAHEVHLDSQNLDQFGRLTLALIRFNFQKFAAPETHGWLLALRCATAHVGPSAAGPLCYDIATLVQTLRSSRSTAFRFNSERLRMLPGLAIHPSG
ncbi:MAG: hypothetical protein ACXIUW_16955 [Roseinatronobacter sp.]